MSNHKDNVSLSFLLVDLWYADQWCNLADYLCRRFPWTHAVDAEHFLWGKTDSSFSKIRR